MMKFRFGLLLCIAALILLSACETNEDPYHPPQYPSNFSINRNGSNLHMNDARVIGIGDVFYEDDDTIFYLSSKLMRKDLSGITYFQIVPDSLTCAGDNCLIINREEQRLYFIANDDLYSCGFWGEDLQNLTPQNTKRLAEPHLSANGSFITMVGRANSSQGYITTYDMDSGVLTQYNYLPPAWSAFYNPETNTFVYQDSQELKTIDASGENPVTLGAFHSFKLNMQQSFDGRYLFVKAQDSYSRLDDLWAYDYYQRGFSNMGATYRYALAVSSNNLYQIWGTEDMAQLICRNLDTGESDIIFNGIYEEYRMTGANFLSVRTDEGRIYVKSQFTNNDKGLLP